LVLKKNQHIFGTSIEHTRLESPLPRQTNHNKIKLIISIISIIYCNLIHTANKIATDLSLFVLLSSSQRAATYKLCRCKHCKYLEAENSIAWNLHGKRVSAHEIIQCLRRILHDHAAHGEQNFAKNYLMKVKCSVPYKHKMQISSDNRLALDIDSYSMLKRTMSVSFCEKERKKLVSLSLGDTKP